MLQTFQCRFVLNWKVWTVQFVFCFLFCSCFACDRNCPLHSFSLEKEMLQGSLSLWLGTTLASVPRINNRSTSVSSPLLTSQKGHDVGVLMSYCKCLVSSKTLILRGYKNLLVYLASFLFLKHGLQNAKTQKIKNACDMLGQCTSAAAAAAAEGTESWEIFVVSDRRVFKSNNSTSLQFIAWEKDDCHVVKSCLNQTSVHFDLNVLP